MKKRNMFHECKYNGTCAYTACEEKDCGDFDPVEPEMICSLTPSCKHEACYHKGFHTPTSNCGTVKNWSVHCPGEIKPECVSCFEESEGKSVPQTILIPKGSVLREEFRFDINTGGDLELDKEGTIHITFLNGVFHEVLFPFSGMYNRAGWRILKAIAEQIEIIEKEMEKK